MEKSCICKGNRVVIVERMRPERRDKGRIRIVDEVRKKMGQMVVKGSNMVSLGFVLLKRFQGLK